MDDADISSHKKYIYDDKSKTNETVTSVHEHEPEEGGAYEKSHLLIMVLGCLIPIAIIIVVVSSRVESAYLPLILVLLCPLLMFLMHLPRMLPRKGERKKTINKTDTGNRNEWTHE